MAFAVPEMLLLEGAADYVVLGEGEITFHELLQAIEHKRDVAQIKGLCYLDEAGCVCRTPDREFADLADFPIIDWSLVDPRKYFSSVAFGKRRITLYSSKGCPKRCAFCSNESFHRRTYRKRPNEYVVSEIESLKQYGLDNVHFCDEMFGVNKRDLYDLCDKLRNLNISWSCQTGLCHLSREDLQHMYDAGCRWISFGVESGSPEMLKRMRKGINLEDINRDFQNCKEIGIMTAANAIFGLPDETEEQLRETVRLMLRIDASFCQVALFVPIPCTEFYDDLAKEGRLRLPETLREWGRYSILKDVVNYSQVPTKELYVLYCFFMWRSLFRKDTSKGTRPYGFVLSVAASARKMMLQHGLFGMFRYAFPLVGLFFTAAWYRFAYPGILRKYGLK